MYESDKILTPQESRYHKALDERLYDLSDEQRSFFKDQSGIQDEEELKAHIFRVQAEAYKVCTLQSKTSEKLTTEIHAIFQVHSYPCIRYFGFTR